MSWLDKRCPSVGVCVFSYRRTRVPLWSEIARQEPSRAPWLPTARCTRSGGTPAEHSCPPLARTAKNNTRRKRIHYFLSFTVVQNTPCIEAGQQGKINRSRTITRLRRCAMYATTLFNCVESCWMFLLGSGEISQKRTKNRAKKSSAFIIVYWYMKLP